MEEIITWKKEYEVGILEIDAEHRVFVKTIQKINDAYVNNYDKKYIGSLIRELYKYVDFHFLSEENIMLHMKYPEYAAHKQEHLILLEKLTEIIGSFDIEFIDRKELIAFLIKWFYEHTVRIDQKFARFLRRSGYTEA